MIAPFLLPMFYQCFTNLSFTNSNDTRTTRMILEFESNDYFIIYYLLYFKITLSLYSK